MRQVIFAGLLLCAISASAQDLSAERAVIQAAVKEQLFADPRTRNGGCGEPWTKLVSADTSNIEMTAMEFTRYSQDQVGVQFRPDEAEMLEKVRSDYVSRNDVPLDMRSALPGHFVVVDLESFTKGSSYDWEKLGKQYSDDIVIMQISRPGFTAGGTEAMLRIDLLMRDRPRACAYYRMALQPDGSWASSRSSSFVDQELSELGRKRPAAGASVETRSLSVAALMLVPLKSRESGH